MQIILQAWPYILIFNGIENKVNRVLVDSKVNNEFQNKRHHIYDTSFNFDIKIISAFSLSLKLFAITQGSSYVISQVSNNLVVVVDLLFGELGLRLVPYDVEDFLFLFILVHFDLLNVL